MTDQNIDQNPNIAGNGQPQPQPQPQPQVQRDMRPTDIEYFLAMLPVIAGPQVAKSQDSTSGASMAIATMRELCGQLVTMGLLRQVGMLPGGQPLSIGGVVSAQGGVNLGAPVPAHDGRMVKQFPTIGNTLHAG